MVANPPNARGWNKDLSIQTSFYRRCSDGLAFGLNWTLGLSNGTNAGARLEHAPDGTLRSRADQAEADEKLGRAHCDPCRRRYVSGSNASGQNLLIC